MISVVIIVWKPILVGYSADARVKAATVRHRLAVNVVIC